MISWSNSRSTTRSMLLILFHDHEDNAMSDGVKATKCPNMKLSYAMNLPEVATCAPPALANQVLASSSSYNSTSTNNTSTIQVQLHPSTYWPYSPQAPCSLCCATLPRITSPAILDRDNISSCSGVRIHRWSLMINQPHKLNADFHLNTITTNKISPPTANKVVITIIPLQSLLAKGHLVELGQPSELMTSLRMPGKQPTISYLVLHEASESEMRWCRSLPTALGGGSMRNGSFGLGHSEMRCLVEMARRMHGGGEDGRVV